MVYKLTMTEKFVLKVKFGLDAKITTWKVYYEDMRAGGM